MWGYGGFKIPIFADYRPGWTGWLAAGGALGGRESPRWRESSARTGTTTAGWPTSRHVFDDAIAVAEDLISHRGVDQ